MAFASTSGFTPTVVTSTSACSGSPLLFVTIKVWADATWNKSATAGTKTSARFGNSRCACPAVVVTVDGTVRIAWPDSLGTATFTERT